MLARCFVCALAASAATLAATASHAAGAVEVVFAGTLPYTDIGRSPADQERAKATLARHMQRWAARLPDGQSLRIEVLDVDLAGELRFTSSAREVRVLTGGADVPRLQLRYTLQAGGTTLRQGEARLVELNYLDDTGQRPPPGDGGLPYERRLLERWFDETLGRTQAQ